MRPGQDGRRPSLPSCWMFKTRRRRMDKKGNHSYWAAIFKSLQVYKLNGLGAVSWPCCFFKISLFFVCFLFLFSLVGFPLRFLKSQKLPAELSGRNVGISSRRRRWDGWRETLSLRLRCSDRPYTPQPPTRPLASSFLRPAALLHKPPLLTGPHPSAVERKQTQQAAGEKKERKVVKETHNLVFSSASLRAQSSRLSVPPPCWPVGVLVTPAGWKNATAHPAHRLRFFIFF